MNSHRGVVPRRWPRAAVSSLGVLVALLAFPMTAGAATQLGQLPAVSNSPEGCVDGVSSVQTGVATGTTYEVPPGGGVITSWQHMGDATTPGSGRLQVWTPPASGTTYTLAGKSNQETFTASAAPSYSTRIPVSAGQLLGLRTVSNDQACEFQTGLTADTLRYSGGFSPDPAQGATQDLLNPLAITRINVLALLEPDADHDGFGDGTQDQCASDPATQGACQAARTGQRAAALNKCKKKPAGKRRKHCIKRAKQLPV